MPYTEHQDSSGWLVTFDWFRMNNQSYVEMFGWLHENVKGYYWRDPESCDSLRFEREEDAFAFKMVWSNLE